MLNFKRLVRGTEPSTDSNLEGQGRQTEEKPPNDFYSNSNAAIDSKRNEKNMEFNISPLSDDASVTPRTTSTFAIRPTLTIYLLVLLSSISGLLFGYDTGVISSALVTIGSDLGPSKLSDLQEELITSSTTLGALIGSLAAGASSDYTGRRPSLLISDVLFIAGAIIQSLSHNVGTMIAGRFLVGLGVGGASCVAPVYIQELSPRTWKWRGRMVTLNVVLITGGQVVAYGIGAAFERTKGGWRWMVGLGAVPAFIQAVLLLFMPESPRLLVLWGRVEKARKVLALVCGAKITDEDRPGGEETREEKEERGRSADQEVVDYQLHALREDVKRSVTIMESYTFSQRLRMLFFEGVNRRALTVACVLQAFQQLCGFNTLMYYSASLFQSIGFNNPTAVGTIIAATNFIFTLVAVKYIDIIGRRRIMLITSPGMIIGLSLGAISFHFLTLQTNNQLVEGTKYSNTWSALVLLSMILFVASYATGLGNVPWQQGELFSLEGRVGYLLPPLVRGPGTSLATATNWSCNLLINSTYLSLMSRITPSGAFGFYAGLCLLGWIFCIGWYPETAGLGLEEVRELFVEGWGVRGRGRRRKEEDRPTKSEL